MGPSAAESGCNESLAKFRVRVERLAELELGHVLGLQAYRILVVSALRYVGTSMRPIGVVHVRHDNTLCDAWAEHV